MTCDWKWSKDTSNAPTVRPTCTSALPVPTSSTTTTGRTASTATRSRSSPRTSSRNLIRPPSRPRVRSRSPKPTHGSVGSSVVRTAPGVGMDEKRSENKGGGPGKASALLWGGEVRGRKRRARHVLRAGPQSPLTYPLPHGPGPSHHFTPALRVCTAYHFAPVLASPRTVSEGGAPRLGLRCRIGRAISRRPSARRRTLAGA